ncbi:hypothetical protein [Fundidesulfovibrio magnetotacticus]|uniref:hypothetical protein n=1 Tax=Fundidesulfovibrio magnetotacticus TaxID=2730080 RepID=UPI0015674C70|nr:hypothetical protein [Fundidesulfovibrio magnetotacticus]
MSSAVTSNLAPLVEVYCTGFKATVDTKNKVMVFEGLPKGESAPVRAELHGYRLHQEGGRVFIGYASLRANRDWLRALVEALLPQKRVLLPEDTPYDLLKQHL